MKKCSTCGETKSLSDFYKNKFKSDGLRPACKSCAILLKKEYCRSKKGLLTQIYAAQRSNSKTRLHDLPSYTLQELREWAYSKSEFHELYDNWKSSGYQKALHPSFNRLDNEVSYTLSNLQIVTWAENCRLTHKHIAKLQSKAVLQLVKETGEILARFDSTREAQRSTGINQARISETCRNKSYINSNGRTCIRRAAGGFNWKYVKEEKSDV